jgi:hypothetical protein
MIFMNQFFSLKRFRLLVLKHWADNRRRYILSVLAFVGLLTAWFGLTLLMHEDQVPMSQDVQQTTFFFLLFVIGTLYASQYFRDLGSRTKGSNFLLIPASSFEKLLCGILYTAVFFPLVFIVTFYLADSLMVALANAVFKWGEKARVINIFTVNFFHFNSNRALNFLLFFLSVQSVFLLGSVYFRKYNFIKTIISCFIIWMLAMVVLYAVHNWVTRLDNGPVPDEITLATTVLAYIIGPLLWWVAYYRLKAKQA